MTKRAKKKAAKKQMMEIIIQAIEDSGENVNALATRSGVKQPTLFRFITERRNIRLDSVQKLCDALGLDLVRGNPD